MSEYHFRNSFFMQHVFNDRMMNGVKARLSTNVIVCQKLQQWSKKRQFYLDKNNAVIKLQ